MAESLLSLENILILISILSLLLSITFILADVLKKRKLSQFPFISFIISNNNNLYLRDALKSIYSSYDKKLFEIFIISSLTDEKEVESLKRKYKFKLVSNIQGKGKAAAVDRAFSMTKGDFIFICNSDAVISKEAVYDMLARFEYNSNLGGISCRQKVMNRRGFISSMQDLEYNMLSFVLATYNILSTPGLWGSFMAFRRRAFMEIGELSTKSLSEDMNAALKLNEKGWKVEQSYIPVYVQAPSNLKALYKQKVKWGAGMTQNLILSYKTFNKTYLKNPLLILFILSYTYFSFMFIFGLVSYFSIAKILLYAVVIFSSSISNSINYIIPSLSSFIYDQLKSAAVYLAFTITYVVFDKEDRTDISRYFLLIPFALIYLPVYLIVNFIGFLKMLFLYAGLKREKVG